MDAVKAADLRGTAIALPNEAGGESPPAEGTEGDTVPPVDHEVTDRLVRGLTTFGDLKSWGVTEEMWMGKFGEAMGSRSASLKDWAEDTGRSMSETKNTAQELVDSGV